MTRVLPESLRQQIDRFAAQAGHRTVEQINHEPKPTPSHEPRRWWTENDR